MELAREEAILAQENKIHDNRVNAHNMKKESKVRMEEREKNIQEDRDKRKVTVE